MLPERLATAIELRELCRTEAQCCCAYGNIVWIYTSGEPTPAWITRAVEDVVRLGRDYPNGLGLLLLIDSGTKPPSEATRAAIRQAFNDMKDVVCGGVLVIEGHGFMAAAKRSAVTLIRLALHQPFPLKVVGSVAEAIPLLLPMLSATVDPRADGLALERAVAAKRKAFAARPAEF